MKDFVQAAPFDVAEVLVPSSSPEHLNKGTNGLLVEIAVPENSEPGEYSGRIHFNEASAPFSFS